jgi:hypothetical protein
MAYVLFDGQIRCEFVIDMPTIMQAAIRDVKGKNATCNNLLSTRELSAVGGLVSQMAGSDGAVAQRLSPQDATQHELTLA